MKAKRSKATTTTPHAVNHPNHFSIDIARERQIRQLQEQIVTRAEFTLSFIHASLPVQMVSSVIPSLIAWTIASSCYEASYLGLASLSLAYGALTGWFHFMLCQRSYFTDEHDPGVCLPAVILVDKYNFESCVPLFSFLTNIHIYSSFGIYTLLYYALEQFLMHQGRLIVQDLETLATLDPNYSEYFKESIAKFIDLLDLDEQQYRGTRIRVFQHLFDRFDSQFTFFRGAKKLNVVHYWKREFQQRNSDIPVLDNQNIQSMG